MEWYIKVLKNYANFKGRARRKEYWMFVLINVIIYIAFMILIIIIEVISGVIYVSDLKIIITSLMTLFTVTPFSVILSLYVLAILVPSLAVSVRRLHDIGKSGWFILISLIPIVGSIILLVWACQEGMPEANEYGENPKLVQ